MCSNKWRWGKEIYRYRIFSIRLSRERIFSIKAIRDLFRHLDANVTVIYYFSVYLGPLLYFFLRAVIVREQRCILLARKAGSAESHQASRVVLSTNFSRVLGISSRGAIDMNGATPPSCDFLSRYLPTTASPVIRNGPDFISVLVTRKRLLLGSDCDGLPRQDNARKRQ